MGTTTLAGIKTSRQPIGSVSYAQARLWLGISSIGFQVVLAATALLLAVPQRLIPQLTAGLGSDTLAAVVIFLLLAAMQLPFDVFGGYLLPNRFTSSQQDPQTFASAMVRGVAIQVFIFSTTFLLYQRLGQAAGPLAVVCAFVVIQWLLIAAQSRLAGWVGGFRLTQEGGPACPVLASGRDEGFTGGIAGLPGSAKVIVPVAWTDGWSGRVRDAAIRRREIIIASGLHGRGVFAAVGWNAMLLAIALSLPGGGSTSLTTLTTSLLYYSLLSFGGLMLLPSFSRSAVFAADRLSADQIGLPLTQELVAISSDVPEGELSRSVQHESIFHPLPCEQRRLDALTSPGPSRGRLWNVARMSLYGSWAFGGPLSRSVHCNIGRPELWVLLPSD